MTAEEWEACRDPVAMLEVVRPGASDRRLRLLAACCCRRGYPLSGERSVLQLVEAAEAFADGRLDEASLRDVSLGVATYNRTVALELRVSATVAGLLDAPPRLADGIASLLGRTQRRAALDANGAGMAPRPPVGPGDLAAREVYRRGEEARAREAVAQAAFLRCVFTSPGRPPVAFAPAVLTRNDSTPVKLAAVIYNDGDPSTGLLDPVRLAILADALEEAGVDDAAALAHLRGPGPHCRGCHVVDAVLGRG